MNHDANLLFSVLAAELEFISTQQFVEACASWAMSKHRLLADIMAERGWIGPAERADIDKLLARKLARHGGDAGASLRAAAGSRLKAAVVSVADDDLHASFADHTPPAEALALIATRDHVPETRDRYSLSRVHAQGGIGRVWLAHDAAIGRNVALKELRPDRMSGGADAARLLREARVTGQLEHPGIVPIYEVGVRPGNDAPFYTMRFLKGKTLAAAAADYHARAAKGAATPLEFRELLGSFVAVCNALAYAHHRRVLHRDLKPQNIMVGEFGEAMVLDWGLARVAEDDSAAVSSDPLRMVGAPDMTVEGQHLGTPAYMAPEQAEGALAKIGPTTDVFGLGATLYHLLANEAPYQGEDQDSTMELARQAEPVPPRELVPATPLALDAICRKAMAKAPADRHPTVRALADDVKRWLADEPVPCCREGWAVRAARWSRRHSALVAGAVVFVVSALAAAGIATGLIWREQQATARARDLAEEQREVADRERGFAEIQRNRADRAADHAMDLGFDLGRLVDDNLSMLKAMHAPRLQIQERLLQSADALRKDRPNDERAEIAYAQALNFAIVPLNMEGDFARARGYVDQLVPIYEKWLPIHPGDEVYRTRLVNALVMQGALLENGGERRRANPVLLHAVEVSQRFPVPGTRVAEWCAARALHGLASARQGLGEFAEAEGKFRLASDSYRRAADGLALAACYQEHLFLAISLTNIAECLRQTRRAAEGLPLLAEAVDILARMAALRTDDLNAKFFLAKALLAKARALGEAQTAAPTPSGKAATFAAYGKAIADLRELSGKLRVTDQYAETLAAGLMLRARQNARWGNLPDAAADLREARTVLESLPKPLPGQQRSWGQEASMQLAAAAVAAADNDPARFARCVAEGRAAYAKAIGQDPDGAELKAELAELEALPLPTGKNR